MKHNPKFKKLVIDRSTATISSTDMKSMAISIASITEFHKIFSLTDEEKDFFLKGWSDAGENSENPHIKSIVAFGCKALKERRSIHELGYMGTGN